jgi:Txe/YoeB family toxin of toxin-antitoxin system
LEVPRFLNRNHLHARFAGLGKPEALKHALSGYWSRRITDEHRMVYRVEGDALLIAQLRISLLKCPTFKKGSARLARACPQE